MGYVGRRYYSLLGDVSFREIKRLGEKDFREWASLNMHLMGIWKRVVLVVIFFLLFD
jgi:hypothetical protein